ncbi:SAM-dependent methyltransferase [Paenibacillus segetis]|uniref:Ribosomal RNA methyltransferase FtsJ domain-containing protein n=1 Tax=Paenibacillus segetis TaxID=1325360 RepID=A0ABQ1YF50_9BACL|nr:SAM-dependent methyltransferase [Paenibacillus segetis]GGH22752.1 hypothetical protein GCM10008013_21400 [Paenibacillus segetis]
MSDAGHQEVTEEVKEVVTSKFVCTANHGFAPYAQEELHRLFGSVKSTMLVPGEVFAVTLQHPADVVREQISKTEPIFLRHIFQVGWEYRLGEGDTANWKSDLTDYILADENLARAKIAVQVRKSEVSLWEGSAAEFKESIQSSLSVLNGDFVVRDAEFVISVFVGKEYVFAGITSPADNISDWNGGAIRFQREDGQISRAKFKLLEAEVAFGIPFASFREALDIGAAPGGWTSFLLERGLKVTAVDPAKMDASLLSSPRLTYLRKNADNVKFKDNQFDLLVCDMSWSPKGTAKLVTDLLYALAPGGTAIVTVKLLHKKPMSLIQEIIEIFQGARLQVQRAKQLFHNRDEITLYMIKY